MRRVMVWSALVLGVLSHAGRADEQLLPSGFPQAPTAPQPRPPGTAAPVPKVQPQPQPPATDQPKTAPDPKDADRLNDPFAQAREAGGEAARSFNQNFAGDFGGVFYTGTILTVTNATQVVGFTPRVVGQNQTVTVGPGGQKIVTTTPIVVQDPIFAQVPTAQLRTVRIPIAGRYSGILITDNDSPRPTDRVYLGYNYYHQIGAAANPAVGGSNLNREIAGFERTFLDGDASFGMRLPFVQQFGPAGFSNQVVGDLTLLSKFALLGDRRTGNLWSAGLALTAPTGGDGTNFFLADGGSLPHSWLFQPWTGFILNADRAYAQLVTGMLIPTDRRDPTLLNNSLAVGYQLFRGSSSGRAGDGFLTGVTPALEVHVRTPLNHRDPNDVVYFADQVNLTAAVHFRTRRVTFSPAVCVPVAGPRPWDIEAMGYLNVYF